MSTAESFRQLCSERDFLPAELLETFRARLEQEGELSAYAYGLRPFIVDMCPTCGAEGAFRSAFFGHLQHASCEIKWYSSPGKYAHLQLKATAWAGAEASFGTNGLAGAVVFILGALFRTAFALLFIPIHAVLYHKDRKRQREAGALGIATAGPVEAELPPSHGP